MRKYLIPALGALSLSAMVAAPAAAHHVCKDYGHLSDALKSLYGEGMVGTTKKENDPRIELWVSKKGTWSTVLDLPSGRSCLKGSGPNAFTDNPRTAKTVGKRAT